MNIDTETLRESGLGRVVLFYTKCKRVIEPIRRIASQLVDTWTRPILKRSSSYRDKLIPTITQEEMDTAPKNIPKLSVILQQAKLADLGAGKTMRRHAVAVPERNLTEYKVAPRFSQSLMAGRAFGEDALASRRVNKEMLKRLQKRQDGKGEKV
jgi:transcription factor SPN1